MELGEFQTRARSVRRRILTAIYTGKKGHIGGALSCADILLHLYGRSLVIPSSSGMWSPRPLILSKGHSATALLAVLDELHGSTLLDGYNSDGSLVGNNPCEKVTGIEFHTGSLGHGVGLACGVALAHKLKGSDHPVVAIISDGELMEGSTWEGLLFAVQENLNIAIIIDRNHQICERQTHLGNIWPVLDGLGLHVSTINGHDPHTLNLLDAVIPELQRPRVVIAETIKGKGVSFMEGVIRWHHSIPTETEYTAAMEELK